MLSKKLKKGDTAAAIVLQDLVVLRALLFVLFFLLIPQFIQVLLIRENSSFLLPGGPVYVLLLCRLRLGIQVREQHRR